MSGKGKAAVRAAAAAVTLGLAAVNASAANITWDGGAATTVWNDAQNWAGDVLPGAGDNVLLTSAIPASSVISLGGSQVIDYLRMDAYAGAPVLTIGTAADNDAGYTLTLSHVVRGDNVGNVQTIAAKVMLAGDSTWNIVNGYNGNVVVSGIIGSNSAVTLTKEGNNTLVLNGANTFSGSIRVLAGGLTLGGSNANVSGVTASGGSLSLNFNAAAAPASNIVSSTASLVVGGTRGGSTVLAIGKNAASSTNSQAFAATTVNYGASTFSVSNSVASGKTLLNLGTLTRATGGTVNFSLPVTNAVSDSANGYAASIANSNGVLGGWATFAGGDWATQNGTNIIAYSGYTTLSGESASIADNAADNVNITAGSTLDVGQAEGTTNINTLRVSDATARTITVGAGKTLRLGGIGGILTASGTGAVTIGASGNAGTLTAGAGDNAAGEIVVTNATAVTINSAITNNGTGAVALTKSGAGNLTITGANLYTGGTYVNAGTLAVVAGATDPLSSGNIVVSGGTLSLGTGTTQTAGGTVVLANGTISGGTITKAGGAFDLRAGTVSTSLAGTAGILKTGGGTVILSNSSANTFTGDVTVVEGRLEGGGAANVTAVSGNLTIGSVDGGQAASFVNGNGRVTFASSKTLTVYSNGTATFGAGAQYLSGGINVFGGTVSGTQVYQQATVTMSGGTWSANSYSTNNSFTTQANAQTAVISGNLAADVSKTFSVADGDAAIDLLITGGLTGTSNKTISKTGAGLLEIRGAKGFAGTVSVTGGILSANVLANGGTNSSIGSASAASNLILSGGTLRYVGGEVSTDRSFTLGINSGTLDASGTGAVNFTNTAAVALSGSNTARSLTLTGSSTADNTLALAINNNGTGKTSLVKSGAGKWILSGTSAYTGTTSVTGGTLAVNGTLGATAVTVNGTGAVLSGTGTIGGGVTVLSGKLSPGASIGTLTLTGDATIADRLALDIDGTDAGSVDKLIVGGALDITGAIADFTAVGPLDDAAYVFASYGSLNGTFAQVNGLTDGRIIDYDYEGTGQMAVVVPEPTAAAALLLSAGSLLIRRRRRGR